MLDGMSDYVDSITRTHSESTVNSHEPVALMGVAAFLNRKCPLFRCA